ncbi:MAG: VWA domain-containing protein [Burkholderiaceae bacterium]
MTAFRFANPEFLLLLVLLPLLALWLYRKRSVLALAHPDLTGFQLAIKQTRRVKWAKKLPWLRFLALALCVLALSRPQWGFEATKTHREGIAIAMAVDVSSSMGAQDLMLDERRSDRLSVVKHTFNAFMSGDDQSLPGRDGDLIGLVTFARYSDVRSPPTLDHQALTRMLDDVRIVTLSEEDGTAIGAGLMAAIDGLREVGNASRVLILLTDGSHNAGQVSPMQAAAVARTLGIKIYAIGAGTRGTAMMPARKRGGGIEMRPTMVFIDDDGLTELAEHTGGRYFRATDAKALAEIYQEIDRLEKGRNTATSYQAYREVFSPIAGLALLLLLIEVLMRHTWLRVATA